MQKKSYRLFLLCVLLGTIALKAQDSLNARILTPVSSPKPRINGPMIFGVRPEHPIIYHIAVTGEKPLRVHVTGLPKGVSFQAAEHDLRGKIEKPGRYVLHITATNQYGSAQKTLVLKVGETIALTPPMGWNSWNIYGSKVTQEKVLANARAMVQYGLIDHGWSYMNVDDAWQGKRGGKHQGILPDSATFPDMQALCDSVHGMGLKIGIYSTPWIESYGHHIGGSADNAAGLFEPTKEKIARNKKLKPYAIGDYHFEQQDAAQFADWGFDYLKYDWNPVEMRETQAMYTALRNSGRDLVYSLSNSIPFSGIAELSTVANAWRTGGDIRDNWKSLKSRLFTQEKWAPYERPGHWNDPDMMVLGYVGWGKTPAPTQLTADEQYTHMSAWCLMSVPLLLGCDLTKMDRFTLSLLTNDEVLDLNQDTLGIQARLVWQEGENGILAKKLADGSTAAGLFNTGDTGEQSITLRWQDIGLAGKYIVRDLWRQQDMGVYTDHYTVTVPKHGVVLVRLRKVK